MEQLWTYLIPPMVGAPVTLLVWIVQKIVTSYWDASKNAGQKRLGFPLSDSELDYLTKYDNLLKSNGNVGWRRGGRSSKASEKEVVEQLFTWSQNAMSRAQGNHYLAKRINAIRSSWKLGYDKYQVPFIKRSAFAFTFAILIFVASIISFVILPIIITLQALYNLSQEYGFSSLFQDGLIPILVIILIYYPLLYLFWVVTVERDPLGAFDGLRAQRIAYDIRFQLSGIRGYGRISGSDIRNLIRISGSMPRDSQRIKVILDIPRRFKSNRLIHRACYNLISAFLTMPPIQYIPAVHQILNRWARPYYMLYFLNCDSKNSTR